MTTRNNAVKNTVDYDYKSLNNAGMISETSLNQDKFISDMLDSGCVSSLKGGSTGSKKYIQYNKFHNILMELNCFGKIIPECDFTLFGILQEACPIDFGVFDVYYLDSNYIKRPFNDIKNGLFILIPKDYNSQSKYHVTIYEVNQKFGTPINKTEFYFPYIQNVFKITQTNTVYYDMMKYLVNAAVTCDYRKTRISKQRSVHPTLSYNKIRL